MRKAGLTRSIYRPLAAIILVAAQLLPAYAADWPQLQGNAARTGRTADTLVTPVRARWIWCGPNLTLRNKASNSAWPDDLTPKDGYSYPMPASVNFTIAESVQPVIVNNRIFFGTQEGKAYAVNADDGSTLWSADIPGGTIASAAVSEDGSTVIFVTLTGGVYGFDTTTGGTKWSFNAKKSVTGAPCVLGGNVYVADHSGQVYSLSSTGGGLQWTTVLPAPVLGGIAADATSVYAGAENMYVYAINRSGGGIRASHRVHGQSFRMLWPVVFNNIVWMNSLTVPIIGSEYVMEQLMTDSGSLAQEESNIALWLQGQGGWADAGADWQHIFAMNAGDMSEPFTVLSGPSEGCGVPSEPVVVDNSNRVLAYFKTRYPKLTTTGAFGTNYSIDIAAVDQTNGHRIPIDNGHLSGIWPWETDNLYAMSVGGTELWLRQNFRGTRFINLANSSVTGVEAQIRYWDGGNFSGNAIIYKDQPPAPSTNQTEMIGRAPVTISGGRAYFCETYCLTAVEH